MKNKYSTGQILELLQKKNVWGIEHHQTLLHVGPGPGHPLANGVDLCILPSLVLCCYLCWCYHTWTLSSLTMSASIIERCYDSQFSVSLTTDSKLLTAIYCPVRTPLVVHFLTLTLLQMWKFWVTWPNVTVVTDA